MAKPRGLLEVYSENIERNLRFLKQRYYEHGSKVSRFLASQLKKQTSLTIIQKVKDRDSEKPFLYKPDEISEAFATFYKKLYSNTDTCTDPKTLGIYLENIKLPKLSDETSQAIDGPITREEIVEAIKGLKNNKSPGSDGYCNKFYKVFVDDLSLILEKAYRYAFEIGELPQNWKETIISLIYKEGKDPTECSSYRPIALQNSDCKILTTILAKKLKSVITTLVHPDQTGFIAGRHLSDNICCHVWHWL